MQADIRQSIEPDSTLRAGNGCVPRSQCRLVPATHPRAVAWLVAVAAFRATTPHHRVLKRRRALSRHRRLPPRPSRMTVLAAAGTVVAGLAVTVAVTSPLGFASAGTAQHSFKMAASITGASARDVSYHDGALRTVSQERAAQVAARQAETRRIAVSRLAARRAAARRAAARRAAAQQAAPQQAAAANSAPAASPPPDTGTITVSRFGTCSKISEAIVPWPAITSGSSQGFTRT